LCSFTIFYYLGKDGYEARTYRYRSLAAIHICYRNATLISFEVLSVQWSLLTWPKTGNTRNTDMRSLTTWIRSEKCVVRQFIRCANV
jgi:hypothetical protein